MKIRSIKFKGKNFTLLVLYLDNFTIKNLKTFLIKKINQSPIFLKNAPIVVNIKSLQTSKNWEKIKTIIQSVGLHIIGFSNCNNDNLKKTIINSGIPYLSEGNNVIQQYKRSNCMVNIHNDSKKNIHFGKIIKKPIRSGQTLYMSNSDIIILNNVSPGAEIIAEGNIHIYGVLRGRVLAGVNGNHTSQIFCTVFFAELISIAGSYWLIDQIPNHLIGKSLHFYLKDGNLNVNLLNKI